MEKIKNWSLKTKMMLLVSLAVIAAVGASTVVLLTHSQNSVREEFELRIISVVRTTASNLELPVMIGSKNRIDVLLDNLLDTTPDLVGARVFDRDGNLLTLQGDFSSVGESREVLEMVIKVTRERMGDEFELEKIETGDEKIGNLVLVFSTIRLQKKLHKMLWSALVMTLTVIVLVIVIVIRFSATITNPLFELCLTAQKVADGDLSQRSGISGKDEIGRLAETFDGMMSALTIKTIELERSNKELDAFAHVASHDLKEPLRKIITFGDILKDDFGCKLGEDGKDYINIMISAAKRMKDLIEDLLKFSRVTTKAKAPEPVDLNITVKDVLFDLEVRIKETKGRIDVQQLPVVLADPLQMRQLLQNLIDNSLKYHRDDISPIVNIQCRTKENGLVEVVLSDNGIGFDSNQAESIFTIFKRLHSKDSKFEGTGVGLSICRKIVESHGGEITANGRPGQGSILIFTLPIAKEVYD